MSYTINQFFPTILNQNNNNNNNRKQQGCNLLKLKQSLNFLDQTTNVAAIITTTRTTSNCRRRQSVIWYLHCSNWLLTLCLLIIVIVPERCSLFYLIAPSATTITTTYTNDNDSITSQLLMSNMTTISTNISSVPYGVMRRSNKNGQSRQESFVSSEEVGLLLHTFCNSTKACSVINKHSICLNGTCRCSDTSTNINSTCIYTARTSNFHPEHMLPIMIVLGVMFIGICIAMNLFSRARFRNQRNAFIAGRVPKRHRPSLPIAGRTDQQRYQYGARSISMGPTPTPTPSPQPQMC